MMPDDGRGEERERAEAGPVSGLRRALAAPDAAPRPLPLRVLSAPLRAGLAMPQLRRAPDDRPHEHDRGHDLSALPRLDAEASVSERMRELASERRVAPSILSADFSKLGSRLEEV